MMHSIRTPANAPIRQIESLNNFRINLDIGNVILSLSTLMVGVERLYIGGGRGII